MKLRSAFPAALALPVLLSLTACPSGSSGDDERGGDSTGEGESTHTSAPGSESAGEHGETSASETTATGGESNEDACMAACANYEMCGMPLEGCMDGCLAQIEQFEPGECQDAEVALLDCIAGLTCEEVEVFYEGEAEPAPCEEQAANLCYCGIMIEGSENPGECSFEYSCTNGEVHAIACDGTICTCLENGLEVGSCEAVDFCSSVAGDPLAGANACCDWALVQPLG